MRTYLASFMLLAAAACGDDDGVRHLDGGLIPDTSMQMIDAPITPEPVTLTVKVDGVGQQNVKVYFLAPDNTVISNTMTDATGVASALMPNGGSVTAIDPYSTAQPLGLQPYQLFTFAGVKPGDQLKLQDTNGTKEVFTSIQFDAPVDTDPNVTGYEFWTPCASGSVAGGGSASAPTVTLNLPPACSTTTDVLVTSHDINYQVVHYFYAKDKALTAMTNFNGATWVAPTTKTYTVTNPNVLNGGDFLFNQKFSSPRGQLYSNGMVLSDSGPPAVYTLAAPNFANAFDLVTLRGGVNRLDQALVDWGLFPANHAYTVDLATRALVDVDTLPMFDSTMQQIQWTPGSTGAAPQFSVGSFTSFGSTRAVSWMISQPYSAGTITLPTLPTDVADFTITADDDTRLQYLGFGTITGGYDAVRPIALDAFRAAFGNDGDPETAASGVVLSPTGSATIGVMYAGPAFRTVPTKRRLTSNTVRPSGVRRAAKRH